MIDPTITPGNGMIFYFRTENMSGIRENVKKIGGKLEEEIRVNVNTQHEEFSLRDPDGYYWTVTDFHSYEG